MSEWPRSSIISFVVAALFFFSPKPAAVNHAVGLPVTQQPPTWDGGGVTNNWSEAANWSGDTVPGSVATAIFDGTSMKDATVDVNFNVNILQINAGYTGTITQASVVNLTLELYSQASGTFTTGSGTKL